MIAWIAAVLALVAASGIALWWLKRPKAQATVAAPPPVESVAPPVAGPSPDIMKSYREARTAVTARDFAKAEKEFSLLSNNPAVQEPTRTWAGVEAVLAALLDGRVAAARQQARDTVGHARSLPRDTTHIGDDLIATLDQLDQLAPLPGPAANPAAASTSGVLATMLAGLKNWEQGMPDQAAPCFTAVIAAKLPQDDQWATIYQRLAADYLVDYQLLSGPLFTAQPSDKDGCEAAIRQLETALSSLKTRGRAKFNVRAWQLDLTRRAKLAAAPEPAKSAPPDDG
jgi:hypothetical protein